MGPADARLRQAREDAGVTAILHESVPVRYWDHDLGPAQLRLFAVAPPEAAVDLAAAAPAAPGQDGAMRPARVTSHLLPGAPWTASPSASRRTAGRSRGLVAGGEPR